MSITVLTQENEQLVVPMVFDYKLDIDLTSGTTTTFSTVNASPVATYAQMIGVENQKNIKYDIAGIPYNVTAPDGITLTWGSANNISDDFYISGSIQNAHEKYLTRAKVFLSMFDIEGNFLDVKTNWRSIATEELPINPGESADFTVSADDIELKEIGFYRVHLEVNFGDFEPKKLRD